MKISKGLRQLLRANDDHGELVFAGADVSAIKAAIFLTAYDSSSARAFYFADAPLRVAIGDGYVLFFGEELREDDLAVWMHLVALAGSAQSSRVSFEVEDFLRAVGWSVNAKELRHLLAVMRRLATCGIERHGVKDGRSASTPLVASYEYSASLNDLPWSVRLASSTYAGSPAAGVGGEHVLLGS